MGVKKKTKPKGKGKGGPKFVTKEEKRDSFFNFFKPPEVPEPEKDEDDDKIIDEDMELLNEDFDIGLAIKEKLISKAVLYFTGEADDIDIDDDFDEDTDDEDEDDD